MKLVTPISLRIFLERFIGLSNEDAIKLGALTHKQLKQFRIEGVKTIPFEVANKLGKDGSALWVLDGRNHLGTYENPFKQIDYGYGCVISEKNKVKRKRNKNDKY